MWFVHCIKWHLFSDRVDHTPAMIHLIWAFSPYCTMNSRSVEVYIHNTFGSIHLVNIQRSTVAVQRIQTGTATQVNSLSTFPTRLRQTHCWLGPLPWKDPRYASVAYARKIVNQASGTANTVTYNIQREARQSIRNPAAAVAGVEYKSDVNKAKVLLPFCSLEGNGYI